MDHKTTTTDHTGVGFDYNGPIVHTLGTLTLTVTLTATCVYSQNAYNCLSLHGNMATY